MSSISKRRREGSRAKIKSMGDHREFLKRITKTLYYGQLPSLPCLSLPVTEISCEVWSLSQRGRSLRRLHPDAAASVARSACVSPCALVLAMLYLERLHACNPDYLANTPPADLFLVSLMVGNKFLQDDGEDDEVICSEWAESGGLELGQLKKLELEFLSAIEWNVFVNEKKFETGLSWLERRVALKQAHLRGFFTYGDLAASCGAAPLGELLGALGASCAALALAYLTGLLALLGSALLVSQACLPALHHLAATAATTATTTTDATSALDTNATHARTSTHGPARLPELAVADIPNSTLDLLLDAEELPEAPAPSDKIMCCSEWLRHRETASAPKRNWYDSVVINDWKSSESWWSTTSAFNWLYRSSLVNPMQRWLERVSEYADLFRSELIVETPRHIEQCHERQRCLRQWLNLSRLSAWMITVSDR